MPSKRVPSEPPAWLDTLILWIEILGLIGAILTGGYALLTLLGL